MKKVLAVITVLAAFVAWIVVTTAVAAHAATTVTSTNVHANGWAFDETRATGHYQYTNAGLHIWTEGATSTDKVAGYVSVSTSLSAVAAGPAPSLNYTTTLGIEPGLQLVIVPNDGVPRILVGETIYGDKWWMPNSYCGTPAGWCDSLDITWSGGGGSAHSATLAQWSTALDETSVSAFGFSLGSGVHADGTIKSLVLGDTTYKFCYETPPTTTSTSTTTTTTMTSSGTTTSTTSNQSTSSTTSRPTSTVTMITSTSTRNIVVPVRRTTQTNTDLASTGASPLPLVVTAGLLLLIGGALLFGVRRTRTRG